MIVFSSVSKQFLPDNYALKDLSFEVNPGELILLTGPSGSGKTTVMKLLTKEYNPTDGEILFHKESLNDIKNSQLHTHRRKIGVVFQDYKLIPELNVWENIALPLSIIGKSEHEIEERVTDLLELVSLTDKAMHFPQQLSGGEAQRISIARALSTAPAIVFADEPTGNLDQENSLQIAKLLSKINELGTTVLFATHDHDVIDSFSKHRHIVLENGEMVSDSAQKDKKTTAKPKEVKKETSKIAKEDQVETKTQDEDEDHEDIRIKIEVKKKPQKTSFWSNLFSKKKPTPKISLKETSEPLELETEPKTKEKTENKKEIAKKVTKKTPAKKTEKVNDEVKEDQDSKKESKSRKKPKKKTTTKKS